MKALWRIAVLGGSRRTGALAGRAARAAGADVDVAETADALGSPLTDRELDGIVVVPSAALASTTALIDELLAALRAIASPPPVVLVTSFVVGHASRHALNDDTHRFRDRVTAEQRLRRASVPHIIVRPTWLTDDPPGQAALRLTQDPHVDGLVGRADLAGVCVAALATPETWNTTFAVYAEPGPADDLATAFAGLIPDPPL